MSVRMATGRDPRWESRLKPQLMSVAEQLSPRRNLLSSRLFSANLISENEEERLSKSDKTETELALEILALLRKQTCGSFDTFCKVLLQTKDPTLREVEKHLRSYSEDNIDCQQIAEPTAESSTDRCVATTRDQPHQGRGNYESFTY